MRTFFGMTSKTRHRHGRRPAAALSARLRACDPRRQDGFLLIEVMVSALIVALIVTATFNGLDVATRFTKDQRHHDQAQILAAQSQEQLRTEPASALDALESNPHKYSTVLGGTTYTITQEAKPVSAAGNTTGCNATESTAQTGANILITSTVTWPQQVSSKIPSVKQGSVISPPTGSALEVDVLDGESHGVAGVTARAKFIPNEAGSYNTVEGTTSSAGCIILTGIQATSATVEIVEKAGFVTKTGALKVASQELTIAPNITTHYQVIYAEAGRITPVYTYEGATSFGGKEVKGDTFVAFNGETGIKPEYELGSTAFGEYEKTAEEAYRALTGTYAKGASTATGAKYPLGRLFPFKSGWTVFAGDCPANNLNKEDEAIGGTVVVKAGSPTTVKVPLAYSKLSIYTGSSASEPVELTKETSKGGVKITNTSCSGAEEPLNAYSPIHTHEQNETLTEGRLENPFMPFGNFQICVSWKKEKAYTVSITNSKATGSTNPAIYLKQRTPAEKATEIAAAKTLAERFATETAAAKVAETEREATEKGPEMKAYWEKLEKEAKITKAQLTTKEKTKATLVQEETEGKLTKAARETAEKTTETKAYWEKLEKEGKLTKAQLTTKETTKATLAAEKAAAAAAKTERVKEEELAATANTNRKERETAEAANGVTVEAKPSC
jgi:Tfp pilus assembly protein PilV